MTESPAFRALSDVVLAMASEREVEPVLQRLVHAARELGGARYAALGVPDGEGAFSRFITSGMSEELIEAMGPLPRTHGLLGAMLESPEPYRIDDIHTRPALPRLVAVARIPDMRSFLGVPVVARGRVIGAVYLTDKVGAPSFSDDDERLIGLLAAHAAIAIENARLNERSRELSIVEERNRLARELHDNVTQRLFGVALAVESAATLLDARRRRGRRGARARARARARRDGGAARGGVRAAARLARGGGARDRAAQARRRAAARVGRPIELAWPTRRGCRAPVRRRCSGSPRRRCRTRSATPRPTTSTVRLEGDGNGGLVLSVADDGQGFDPARRAVRGRRLGLTSMEERAEELGGTLDIESAAGEGTRVRLEVAA